jgi:hypothetical protein
MRIGGGWDDGAAERLPVFVQVVAGRSRRWMTRAVGTNTDDALLFADDLAEEAGPEAPEEIRVITEDELRDEGGERAVRQAYADLDRLAERAATREGRR